MFNPIGRCKVDFKLAEELILEEIQHESDTSSRDVWQTIYPLTEQLPSDQWKLVSDGYNRTFPEIWYKFSVDTFKDSFHEWAEDVNDMILKCYYIYESWALVGTSCNSKAVWLLPVKSLEIETYKDYSRMSGSERRLSIEGLADSSGIRTLDDKSLSEVRSDKSAVESSISELEQQMKGIEDAKTDTLAKLQAEIDAKVAELNRKKSEMLAELEDKKAEMEKKLQEMEVTILRIDSEIYKIRCYNGEVVELKTIRSGKPAPSETPMVFYQKLKYLDEELGKFASIYRADFSDAKSFEDILRYRNDIFESMLPNDRCIQLIRVSRTNSNFIDVEGRNVLERFEKYKGEKIAILARDGENLYIVWTDDDRIYFSDDAFYRPGESITEDYEPKPKCFGESDKQYDIRMRNEAIQNVKESLGRAFVFVILQGLIDNNLIEFPDNVNIANSRYVVMSYADGYLTTNKYGQLSDMIHKCNKSVKVGDSVLTVQSLRAQAAKYSYSNNDRGIGYANRTHDVYAKDCEVYKINLIRRYGKYERIENPEMTETFFEDEFKAKSESWRSKYRLRDIIENSYYISLHKRWSESGTARANFQVFSDEFINLTFMNSVWLTYVLTNHKSNGISIGNKSVDFAHIIPYIKKALEFTKSRESQIASWISEIDESILDDSEWPAKLSEWMLSTDTHNFSRYTTKRFIKSLK